MGSDAFFLQMLSPYSRAHQLLHFSDTSFARKSMKKSRLQPQDSLNLDNTFLLGSEKHC